VALLVFDKNKKNFEGEIHYLDLTFLKDPEIAKSRDEDYKWTLIEKGKKLQNILKDARKLI
jgi:hypothetical protein